MYKERLSAFRRVKGKKNIGLDWIRFESFEERLEILGEMSDAGRNAKVGFSKYHWINWIRFRKEEGKRNPLFLRHYLATLYVALRTYLHGHQRRVIIGLHF